MGNSWASIHGVLMAPCFNANELFFMGFSGGSEIILIVILSSLFMAMIIFSQGIFNRVLMVLFHGFLTNTIKTWY